MAKRTIGDDYAEHFASVATPKKNEIIAAFYRHGGDKRKSREFYEAMMRRAFAAAHARLKPNSPLLVVYAHKTTVGWSTLVDGLRGAGFQVNEAWPIDTEMAGGMRTEKASLASSIFLLARKRESNTGAGSYESSSSPNYSALSASVSKPSGTWASPDRTW